MILALNIFVEGGGNSKLAQQSPVSQENTLLSAFTTLYVNIFSPKINLLRFFFVFFCRGDLHDLKHRLIRKYRNMCGFCLHDHPLFQEMSQGSTVIDQDSQSGCSCFWL